MFFPLPPLLMRWCINAVETWAIAFSPDGRLIASSSKSGNINLWSVETGEKAQTLEPSGKFTMCVAFVRYARAYVSVLLLHRPLILFFCVLRAFALSAEPERQVRGVRCGGRSGDRF